MTAKTWMLNPRITVIYYVDFKAKQVVNRKTIYNPVSFKEVKTK